MASERGLSNQPVSILCFSLLTICHAFEPSDRTAQLVLSATFWGISELIHPLSPETKAKVPGDVVYAGRNIHCSPRESGAGAPSCRPSNLQCRRRTQAGHRPLVSYKGRSAEVTRHPRRSNRRTCPSPFLGVTSRVRVATGPLSASLTLTPAHH